jgi:CheY-like chemotaxis protein
MRFVDDDEFGMARALVIDGNGTSRSILVSQLKDLGVGSVVQCARVNEARRHLEGRPFDIVLCEQSFGKDTATGQDLLDDLRRNQLLPFSTVFIMVTGEATYAKVAEAAESALDGYLLKPHTAAGLVDRLRQARLRKIALKDIFEAIEAEDFERAAQLCMERFETQGPYWLYAARIGAELLLRLEKFSEAQTLFESVVAAKALPWAKLGVARSMLDAGEPGRAATTLERLVSEEPGYADAYDVLGRAQFELGRFDRALDLYKMACQLTPHSISRLQNLGMTRFYAGDRAAAEETLAQAVLIGLDSKLFDPQTLVLLGFVRLVAGDRKGLKRCQADVDKLCKRNEGDARYRRLAAVVDVLILLQDQQFARTLEAIRAMIRDIDDPDFDFESATNLISLLAQLAQSTIQLDEVEAVIDKLGMRFCTSRAMSELLAGAASAFPAYAERLHASSARVLKLAEHAMTLSLGGDPSAAVQDLLAHGAETHNGKLIETAHLVLQRYAEKIKNLAQLQDAVQALRERYGTLHFKPVLPGEPKRQAGGLSLRMST